MIDSIIKREIKIKGVNGDIVPFPFWDRQKQLAKKWSMRNLIRKGRQCGTTTYIVARMFAERMIYPEMFCVRVSTHQESAKHVENMERYMFSHSKWAKQFKVGKRMSGVLSLNASALDLNMMHGHTITQIHFVEAGFFDEKAQEAALELLRTVVSYNEFVEIAIESTQFEPWLTRLKHKPFNFTYHNIS